MLLVMTNSLKRFRKHITRPRGLNVVRGMGTVVELWPARDVQLGGLADDRSKILSDWQRVGEDMHDAIEDVRRSGTR